MRISTLIFLIPIIFFVKTDLVAQDGVFFHKSIRLSFKEIIYQNAPLTFELYQTDLYSVKNGGERCTQYFSFDTLNSIYRLSYSIMTIGGGRSINLMQCPEIFVRLNVLDSSGKNVVIPIRFDICEKSEVGEIDIVNIDLNPLLNQPDSIIFVDECNSYRIENKDSIERDALLRHVVKIEFLKE